MIFNHHNKKDFNKLYIHDSIYTGYNYDFDKKEINLTCNNHYLKKIFTFNFCNVIYSKLQSFGFWGSNGFYIFDVELEENNEELKQIIINTQNSKPDWFKNSKLDSNINYITIEFTINTGDKLLIICESVEVSESELNEQLPV